MIKKKLAISVIVICVVFLIGIFVHAGIYGGMSDVKKEMFKEPVTDAFVENESMMIKTGSYYGTIQVDFPRASTMFPDLYLNVEVDSKLDGTFVGAERYRSKIDGKIHHRNVTIYVTKPEYKTEWDNAIKSLISAKYRHRDVLPRMTQGR